MNFRYLLKIVPLYMHTKYLTQRQRFYSILPDFLKCQTHFTSTNKYIPTTKSSKGSMSLFSLLIIFIFSIFGLSLLYLSQIHLKVSSYKRNSVLLEYAAENGIKRGLSHLLDLFSQIPTLKYITESELGQLKESVQSSSNNTEIIEGILCTRLPISSSEILNHQSWENNTIFSLEKLREQENYFLAQYSVSINSEGRLENFKQKREASFSGSVGIFAGYSPLSFLPFILEKLLL